MWTLEYTFTISTFRLVKYLNIDVVKVTSGLKLLFKSLEFTNNSYTYNLDLKNKSNIIKIQE